MRRREREQLLPLVAEVRELADRILDFAWDLRDSAARVRLTIAAEQLTYAATAMQDADTLHPGLRDLMPHRSVEVRNIDENHVFVTFYGENGGAFSTTMSKEEMEEEDPEFQQLLAALALKDREAFQEPEEEDNF